MQINMQINILSLLAAATPLALAAPVDSEAGLVARQSMPNVGAILSDHMKYMADPAAAKIPIPPAENEPVREGHRKAHEMLGSMASMIPGMPGGGGASGGAGGNPLSGLIPGMSGGGGAGGNPLSGLIPGMSGGGGAGGSPSGGAATPSDTRAAQTHSTCWVTYSAGFTAPADLEQRRLPAPLLLRARVPERVGGLGVDVLGHESPMGALKFLSMEII
ncbi:hypothetical protein HIM_10369 [Hirsutella minnesotensis 3608]|uniref:Uncharacterized protein n=1 Tax=Hirsutella minnesotensis 3608 TaxID=1043627 RepID=A0A0F7ZG39_9HYPO|nr:hypothetical protein HIM_10369 [Hirsutella minnesotensis 3608]